MRSKAALLASLHRLRAVRGMATVANSRYISSKLAVLVATGLHTPSYLLRVAKRALKTLYL
jgi:hypothetical protein